jgi:hypothetical protein
MSAFLLWNNDTQTLRFDVVTAEGQIRSNLVTEHPVESGASITDHVRPNLNRVELETFVSNSPLNDDRQQITPIPLQLPPEPMGFGLNYGVNAVGQIVNKLIFGSQQIVAKVLTFPGGAIDFVAETIQTLEALRSQGTLIKVVCPNAVYDNMIVESFEIHRSSTTGDSASFNVALREIRVVTSTITNAPTPTIPRAAQTVDKGSQAAATPDVPTSSYLSNLLSSAGVSIQ